MEESNKRYTSIRYWMKKYGLNANFRSFKDGHDFANGSGKQKNRQKIVGQTRLCPACTKYKKFEKFYTRRKNNCSGWCRQCVAQDTIKRGRKIKLECLEYKGGKCQKCGYDKCQAALDFHHRNPEEKDFSICKKYGCKNMNDRIKKELDKCDLLCANCHREEHFENATQKWFESN